MNGAIFKTLLMVALTSCVAAEKGPSVMTRTSIEDADVSRFRPTRGVAATNSNDVRRFVYDWFTHFEHAAPVAFFLGHLDDKAMQLTFPGMAPFEGHAAFAGWYENLLAQTRWNFHDLSEMSIVETAPDEWKVDVIIDWYGEVRADSPQRASWQSQPGNDLYHHHVRQVWTVKTADGAMTIATLVASVPASA